MTQIRRNSSGLKGVSLPNLGSGILNDPCQISIPSVHPSSLKQSQQGAAGVLLMTFKIKAQTEAPAATLSFYKVQLEPSGENKSEYITVDPYCCASPSKLLFAYSISLVSNVGHSCQKCTNYQNVCPRLSEIMFSI